MITRPEINDFYRGKLSAHGVSAQGVGWKDTESQQIRFKQLVKLIPSDTEFTVNDVGCGTGDLIRVLELEHKGKFNYMGYDALDEMIVEAKKQFNESKNITFNKISGYHQLAEADYSVASGLFNVKNEVAENDWKSYILDTLQAMSDHSRKGFAFNALTSYSDQDKMRHDLFYSDPLYLFDFCKRNFARNVALLHDYGFYDFTILVKRDL